MANIRIYVSPWCGDSRNAKRFLDERGLTYETINIERARQAQKRSEERLRHVGDPKVDFNRAQVALQRALIRLQVAGKAGHTVAAGRQAEEPTHAP